jgi:glycosyltransferase involved in cell wall biosynthesis
MKNKWVAYVGHFLFPWGQAASRRVYANAMSLCDAGYDVVVASGSDTHKNVTLLDKNKCSGSLSHIGLGTCPDQSHSALKKTFRLLFHSSKITIDWLESQEDKPSFIILYGGYTPYMIRLLRWCHKNSVPLIADVVEWYEPSGNLFGKINLSYLNVDFSQRYLFSKCDGIIPISSYLEQYYNGKNCKTLRIPPLVDLDTFLPVESIRHKDSFLTLVYAGSPGKKKDLLANIVTGVLRLDPEGKKIRLIIVGPTVDYVKSISGILSLPSSIQVKGRIPQAKVAGFVRSADFTVLLREPLRFAQAGFPTKFVESLANGTPVIANITSDIGDYLQDGVNGLVCAGCDVESCIAVLKKALDLSSQELIKMRFASQETAREFFEYKKHSKKLNNFLECLEINS